MIRRAMLLAAMVIAVLFGPSALDRFVPGGEQEEDVEQPEEAEVDGEAAGGLVAALRGMAGATDDLRETAQAANEATDPAATARTGRDRLRRLRSSYDELRLMWATAILTIPFTWLLIGFGGVFSDKAFVARRIGETGQWLSETWLGALAAGAPVASFLSGELVWPFVPIEAVLVPVCWMLGSATMLRMIDMNAPVWNQTLRSMLFVLAGMVASALAVIGSPFRGDLPAEA